MIDEYHSLQSHMKNFRGSNRFLSLRFLLAHISQGSLGTVQCGSSSWNVPDWVQLGEKKVSPPKLEVTAEEDQRWNFSWCLSDQKKKKQPKTQEWKMLIKTTCKSTSAHTQVFKDIFMIVSNHRWMKWFPKVRKNAVTVDGWLQWRQSLNREDPLQWVRF